MEKKIIDKIDTQDRLDNNLEPQVTILKNTRNVVSLRAVSLDDVATSIRTGEYRTAAQELRQYCALPSIRRIEESGVDPETPVARNVPRICFSALMKKQKEERTVQAYTGLVLLEVENLSDYDEARAVMSNARLMPQTLMAFIGVSGRSVKIVCRGALANGKLQKSEGDTKGLQVKLPKSEGDIKNFHLNLYEKARLAYNAQLGVTLEKREPKLTNVCYMSDDEEMYYNPDALLFYTDTKKLEEGLGRRRSTMEPDEIVPGERASYSYNTIFEFNRQKALDDVEGVSAEDDRNYLLLNRLAHYCLLSGMPLAIATRLAIYSQVENPDVEEIRLVFKNTYHNKSEERYQERKGVLSLRNIPSETLLMKKINIFLNEYYELRKNVLRGVAEYRLRTGLGYSFHELTEEVRNSITMRAIEQGIKCWDKDIRRYVNSDDIELYDPVNDYLESLPAWDGRDRIGELASRVPTSYKEWPQMFRLWLRSMVAMWRGKNQLSGNALVPLLIGPQGCGKSSFCRILLPPELRDYYNESINFKNEADLNLGLSSFALLNLDEFDRVTKRQQVVLKYLVSTAEVKYRPPYGKAYQSRRRYASFVATTNEAHPLVDNSGSRRFVCVNINGTIDFKTPINYQQLYAQLNNDITKGEPYWPTEEEEQQLIEHNRNFLTISSLDEMLAMAFRKPAASEQGQWLNAKAISDQLKRTFGAAYQEDKDSFRKIGATLHSARFNVEARRRTAGMEYYLIAR
jgi:hypothetical protein